MRFDDRPEFIANAVADWCRFNDVGSIFIDPGSPWQNAWIESLDSRLRDELLKDWHFDSLLEAQVLIEDWRVDDNINWPHSAGGVPAWIQSASEAPGPPWEYVGQLADSQRIGGAVPPSQLPGAGIQRRVDGAFRLEPPDGLAVEQVDRWIVVDDTGSYVPGPNFGHGGIAYLFVDRSQDPPAALMFWQCG